MSKNTNFYLYAHKDLDGTVFYIGKGKGNRAYNQKRNKIWKKIASDGYSIEFIKENMTEEHALAEEEFLIGLLKPKANIAKGGQWGLTGFKHNKEFVKQRNQQIKERWQNPDFRQKASEIQKIAQNRPEVKTKVIKSREIYWKKVHAGELPYPKLKDETRAIFRQKISQYNESVRVGKTKDHRLGVSRTADQKKKISESQSGEKGFWYGKTTALAKKVINLQTGQIFDSATKAAKEHGISQPRFCRYLRKRDESLSIDGLRFKYA